MLSAAADFAQLTQVAPWLAVGLLALVASAWVYRQNRRNLAALEARLQGSNVRQGKRLGIVEHDIGLLDLRRRQSEWELADRYGIELPMWPADGPPPNRARRRDDEELVDELFPATEARRIPVPPLDPAVAARRHRA